jgi:catechol 2,3-dioxygenase-like lactoylglutathione lyase family enzyme
MLGRFLEISIATPAIAQSLEFYAELGFTQLTTTDAWMHPYAVMTDGQLFLGLHQLEMASPLLTFVQPDLSRKLEQLRSRGIEFDSAELRDEAFNQVTFRDPNDCAVRMIEARTFSPSADHRPSLCGYFAELALPAKELDATPAFWEPLGFVALEPTSEPLARTTLTSTALNLSFYRDRALRTAVWVFEDDNMAARIAQLRARGFELTKKIPDGLDARCNALLTTPEGYALLLLQSHS